MTPPGRRPAEGATAEAATVEGEARELLDLCAKGATVHDRPDLVRRLVTARQALAAAGPGGPALREAATVVLRTCDSLDVVLRTRHAELLDPARPARLRAERDGAGARWEAFDNLARDWPAVLGEGFAALSSDLEFTVRTATRGVLGEAEQFIDAGDPRRNRAVFEDWLRERLTYEADRAYRLLAEGARRVAVRVAGHLGEGTPHPVPDPPVRPARELVAGLDPHTPTPAGALPLSTRLLTILMPGYGGIMMALVFSRFLGLHLRGWVIAVGAVVGALALGGAALTGDRRRQLDRRRIEAKAAVRALTDDCSLVLGKEVRDALRSLQHDLRTATSATVSRRTRQLSEELDEAAAADEAARRTGAELADLEADQASVAELRDRARNLLLSAAGPAPTRPVRRLVPVA